MHKDTKAPKSSIPFKQTKKGAVLSVYVSPGASENRIGDFFDGRIKIKIQAPPVDNKANDMCVKYLSDIFSVSKRSIAILSGHNSKKKEILIKNLSKELLEKKLNFILYRNRK